MTDIAKPNGARYYLSWILWPGLVATSMWAVIRGLDEGLDPVITLFTVYIGLVICIALLERIMPHEASWNRNDGQTSNDLFHTLFTYFFMGAVIEAAVLALIAKIVIMSATLSNNVLWPSEWPLLGQFILLLFLGEVGAYTAHRLAHRIPFLWRFHALHHSAPTLYWLNTGRFHAIDVLETIVLALPLPILLGAPADLMFLFTCLTMFIGVLSHCNIEMRFGFLDWIFSTPGVHRWHHSRIIEEGDSNYGENLMIFDVMLGTHFRPADRRPSVVGTETQVPETVLGQLIRPFTGYQEASLTTQSIQENEEKIS